MRRFRYITSGGREHTAIGISELVAAVRSGELRQGQMIFDDNLAKWVTAEDHDAVAAALIAARGGSASRPSAYPPSTPVSPRANPPRPKHALPGANRRIVARVFDNFAFGFAGVLVLGFASGVLWGPPSDENAQLVGSFYALVGMLGFDVACTRLWGTTPGKRLLGMQVVSRQSAEVTWGQARKRTLFLWLNGLGLGLPLVSLVAAGVSMRRVVRTGYSSWDDRSGTEVRYRRAG